MDNEVPVILCRDALHEMCSRHFISAYVPVGDAANDDREVIGRAKQEPDDYRDVGGRATPGAVAEPSTGAKDCSRQSCCIPAIPGGYVREGRVQNALREMCSRHFISAYVPVGDAANDDRDVEGRATPGAVVEPSGACKRPSF